MEPNQSATNFEKKQSAEQIVHPAKEEQAPRLVTPETAPVQSAERQAEQLSQSSAAAVDAAASTAVALTPSTPLVVQSTGSTNSLGALPSVANDDDRIEKEWVEKVKAIVSTTHDNPHEREVQISQLRRAYMQKRHGRELPPTDGL